MKLHIPIVYFYLSYSIKNSMPIEMSSDSWFTQLTGTSWKFANGATKNGED